MKINLQFLSTASLALLVTFASCKKEADSKTDSDAQTETEIQNHSADYNAVTDNVNDADNDISVALEASASVSGRVPNNFRINGDCGLTVAIDSTSAPKSITITYDGNNCAGTYHRSGSIKVTLPGDLRWRNPGASITVSFQNMKYKHLSDNKSVTINGTQTITNLSGGLLINLPSLQSIVHTITSNDMSITFDDNTQRTWHVSRKRTFTFNNGVVLKISGTGVSGNATNLAEWGTNRAGREFTTAITEPIIFRQDCDFRLTSGQIKHDGWGTSTVTFGLNSNGEPAGCPGAGKYYLKLLWTGINGNSHTVITPY